MPTHKNTTIVSVIIIVCVIFSAALVFWQLKMPKKESAAVWREDFIPDPKAGKGSLPAGWKLVKKPGTSPAVFSIKTGLKQNGSFLHMDADKASASLVTWIEDVDITKTPFLRWRWRATILPKEADGREKGRDDQAIGIYVGTGKILDNKSISYRWDTLTPKGAEGNCVYGMGTIKIRWHTLRNKEDLKDNEWFIEERNVALDFKNAWGFYPEKIYLSISCNSQYTKSRAGADIDWIEFIAMPRDR